MVQEYATEAARLEAVRRTSCVECGSCTYGAVAAYDPANSWLLGVLCGVCAEGSSKEHTCAGQVKEATGGTSGLVLGVCFLVLGTVMATILFFHALRGHP